MVVEKKQPATLAVFCSLLVRFTYFTSILQDLIKVNVLKRYRNKVVNLKLIQDFILYLKCRKLI